MMINKQYDSDLLGLIGNNLPKYPDVLGVVLMGESIYKSWFKAINNFFIGYGQ